MGRSKILSSAVGSVIGEFDPKNLPQNCQEIGYRFFELADKVSNVSEDHGQVASALRKLLDARDAVVNLLCPQDVGEVAKKAFEEHLSGGSRRR